MLTTTLGKTGLTVSRMGLGCGGHSRLGLQRGGTTESAIRVIREALDLGVNFIDTAEAYGTEDAVGRALAEVPRDGVVLSTKVGAYFDGRPATPAELRARVDGCLERLRTDYVDILHLHGVMAQEYEHALNVLYPILADLKGEGKIRHIGITEAFVRDTNHRMLIPAVSEGPWEVVMVGFNLLNPSARSSVLPHTLGRSIGTLCMFAVRRALSNRSALMEVIEGLIEKGHEPVAALRGSGLDFLTSSGVAESMQEAAYRFCLWEPGIDVVLSGTGNLEHLRENARSLSLPPLSESTQEVLRKAFGKIDSISGN